MWTVNHLWRCQKASSISFLLPFSQMKWHCVPAGKIRLFLNCRLVAVWDHAECWQQFGSSTLADLFHGPSGVSVFCWSCVWMGFTCFCPEDRGILQLSVRQHHRSQFNTGLRSVCLHLLYFEFWMCVDMPNIVMLQKVYLDFYNCWKYLQNDNQLVNHIFLYFFSFSIFLCLQIAGNRMNSFLLFSPLPPLWTTSWHCPMVSCLTGLGLPLLGSLQCESNTLISIKHSWWI